MGHVWKPARFLPCNLEKNTELAVLNGNDSAIEYPYAVILLNHSSVSLQLQNILLEMAQYRIAADGAANSYNDDKHAIDGRITFPDAICGDMDSIQRGVYEPFSKNPNIKIIEDNDQYSTDFMKCLRHASEEAENILYGYEFHMSHYCESHGLEREKVAALDVAVLGGLGGRADQAFSQIHQLYSASDDSSLNLGDIYLFADKSVMFLLQKGMNIIQTPVRPGFLTQNVGIIPVGRPSIITTRGLEWDVTDWSTEFGGQISTSNHIMAEVVRVKTTERVLFTVELAWTDMTEKKSKINEEGGKDVKVEDKANVKDDTSSSMSGERGGKREGFESAQSKKRKLG